MAIKVTGELYNSITGQLFEIGRQLRQPNGYPFNPVILQRWLQLAIEGEFNLGDFKVTAVPFDPVSFLGKDWRIVEQDERSLSLTEVDFAKVILVHCLHVGELWIKGEESLRRLKERDEIRPDARFLVALLQGYLANKEKSLLERLYQAGILKGWNAFPGTVLLGSSGSRQVLCLYRGSGGKWDWRADWLVGAWDSGSLSVVSPQVS